MIGDVVVQFGQFLLQRLAQPGDALLQARHGDVTGTLTFRSYHLNDLAPASDEFGEHLRGLIRQLANLRFGCLREVRDYRGIDRIGLGRLSCDRKEDRYARAAARSASSCYMTRTSTSFIFPEFKTWMAGINPAMTPSIWQEPMSLQVYLAYIAACVALALLPGPIVTLVIANGLRHGTRAALTNIAGVQAAMTIVIGIVAIGLATLMATMGYWFDWVRFAGAAYLVWLGIKLIRQPVEGVEAIAPPPPRGGFFLQGFLVALSNPKLLVFFGAFIPQFVDMNRDHLPQVAHPRRHLHDRRGIDRWRLRAAGRTCAIVLLGAADAAAVARLRWRHDRRRRLARADAGAIA